MKKQKGSFSNLYMIRKGKQNINQFNTTQNCSQKNEDSTTTYNSNKSYLRQRNSISQYKKKLQEKKIEDQFKCQEKQQKIIKLERQLKYLKDQLTKQKKSNADKIIYYESYISQIQQEKGIKQRTIDDLNTKIDKKTSQIKKFVFWILGILFSMNEDKVYLQDIKNQIVVFLTQNKPQIIQLGIEEQLTKQIQSAHQFNTINTRLSTEMLNAKTQTQNSILTENLNLSDLNIVNMGFQTQPLFDTFNTNQQAPQQLTNQTSHQNYHNQMQKITKKLFQLESHKTSIAISEISVKHEQILKDQDEEQYGQENEEEQQFDRQLPIQVFVKKCYKPHSQDDNYIELKKGDKIKIIRKVRNQLWIGQYGQKIGLVSEQSIQF